MGRPKKGQKAVGIANLEEQKRISTKARLNWLRDLNSGIKQLPDDFDSLTIDSFCKFESADLNIRKQSTNNFKKHLGSDEVINEVKDILTSLRRQRSGPLLKPKPARTDSIASLRREKRELNNAIQILTDDLISLRVAYRSLIKNIEDAPLKDEGIRKAIREQRNRYGLHLIGEQEDGNYS